LLSVSVPGLVPAATVPPEATVTAPLTLPVPPSVPPDDTVTAPVPVLVPVTSSVPSDTVVVPL
jgi:hypothetical protein